MKENRDNIMNHISEEEKNSIGYVFPYRPSPLSFVLFPLASLASNLAILP